MKKDFLLERVKLKSLNTGFSWQDSPILFQPIVIEWSCSVVSDSLLTLIKSVLWVSVLIYDIHVFFSINAIHFFHINFKKTSRTLKTPTLILILFLFFFFATLHFCFCNNYQKFIFSDPICHCTVDPLYPFCPSSHTLLPLTPLITTTVFYQHVHYGLVCSCLLFILFCLLVFNIPYEWNQS